MNLDNVITATQTKADQIIERFGDSLKSLRTGRANASILDGVKIEAYGTTMPLNQAASVVAPEAQLLQITPFDPNNLPAIVNAIRNDASLGLNPADDGRVVRVPIPPLTEERRRELAKQIGQKQEESMIALRSIRHEAIDAIDKGKKDKNISEDDAKRLTNQVEDSITKTRIVIEGKTKDKETELMTL
jgi:ribosome recycling factor